MEAFLVSIGLVALTEMGDKTQLLSLLLAARYRSPTPIVFGIFVATLANHVLAAWAGAWLGTMIDRDTLRSIVGLSFLAMAAWALVPDKLEKLAPRRERLGIFGTTLVAFFLAEMGDKTQLATITLAAHYAVVFPIVAGTTLGMMIANVPAVCLGELVLRRFPPSLVRQSAAATFVLLGALTLVAP